MASKRTLLEKIRVPGLVEGAFPPAPDMTLEQSIHLVKDFLLRGGKTCIMTGAGVSVDSGIRVSSSRILGGENAGSRFHHFAREQAYRGPEGTYTIRKHRPIFYGEFIADEKHRRRYWARSYLSVSPFSGSSQETNHSRESRPRTTAVILPCGSPNQIRLTMPCPPS